MIDVMRELEPIGALFTSAKYKEGLTMVSGLWARVPTPKERLINSYMIVAYAVALAQKEADLDLAWEWAQRGLAYSGSVNLIGESEFLLAEVAYARADLKEAERYFHIAKKLSGKRLFQDKNPEYWKLTQ